LKGKKNKLQKDMIFANNHKFNILDNFLEKLTQIG